MPTFNLTGWKAVLAIFCTVVGGAVVFIGTPIIIYTIMHSH